jgi:hypothetical protein
MSHLLSSQSLLPSTSPIFSPTQSTSKLEENSCTCSISPSHQSIQLSSTSLKREPIIEGTLLISSLSSLHSTSMSSLLSSPTKTSAFSQKILSSSSSSCITSSINPSADFTLQNLSSNLVQKQEFSFFSPSPLTNQALSPTICIGDESLTLPKPGAVGNNNNGEYSYWTSPCPSNTQQDSSPDKSLPPFPNTSQTPPPFQSRTSLLDHIKEDREDDSPKRQRFVGPTPPPRRGNFATLRLVEQKERSLDPQLFIAPQKHSLPPTHQPDAPAIPMRPVRPPFRPAILTQSELSVHPQPKDSSPPPNFQISFFSYPDLDNNFNSGQRQKQSPTAPPRPPRIRNRFDPLSPPPPPPIIPSLAGQNRSRRRTGSNPDLMIPSAHISPQLYRASRSRSPSPRTTRTSTMSRSSRTTTVTSRKPHHDTLRVSRGSHDNSPELDSEEDRNPRKFSLPPSPLNVNMSLRSEPLSILSESSPRTSTGRFLSTSLDLKTDAFHCTTSSSSELSLSTGSRTFAWQYFDNLRLFFESWIEKWYPNLTEQDLDQNLALFLSNCSKEVQPIISSQFSSNLRQFYNKKKSVSSVKELSPPGEHQPIPLNVFFNQSPPNIQRKVTQSVGLNSNTIRKDIGVELPPRTGFGSIIMSGSSPSLTLLPPRVLLRTANLQKLAKYLTLRDHSIFQSIRPNELHGLCWMKEGSENTSPNVKDLISSFNQTALWISSAIVVEDKIKKRVHALTCALDLLEEMMFLRNWHGVQTVIAGLSHASVSRLRRTWGSLEKTKYDLYLKKEEVFSPLHNWISCRRLLKECSRPAFPYIGIALSDLVFVEEGNADTIRQNEISYVNFQKHVLQGEIIDGLLQYQQPGYQFQEQLVINKHKQINFEPVLSESALYEQSLIVEPRIKK